MKTPSLDAPMTDQEVLEAFGAWNALKINVAERDPKNMIEMLEQLSPIMEQVFELRKTLNGIWQHAEDRHYGRLGVVKPFRRGVSPKTPTPTRAPKEDLIGKLGITEEQLNAALAQVADLNLLSPPEGGPGDEE